MRSARVSLCALAIAGAAVLPSMPAGAQGTIHSIAVLADPELRESIKEYSDWPTIPQVYIGGEFIGGCDITRELYATGELQTRIEKALTTAG